MSQRRPTTALLLLAVFLFGGLLGPSLHRLEHAEARDARQQAAVARCADHGPHAGPSWEAALPALDDAPCLLCTRALVGLNVAPSPAAQASLTAATSAAPPATRPPSGPACSSLFARGPPVRS
jgi:hypothetical protein